MCLLICIICVCLWLSAWIESVLHVSLSLSLWVCVCVCACPRGLSISTVIKRELLYPGYPCTRELTSPREHHADWGKIIHLLTSCLPSLPFVCFFFCCLQWLTFTLNGDERLQKGGFSDSFRKNVPPYLVIIANWIYVMLHLRLGRRCVVFCSWSDCMHPPT